MTTVKENRVLANPEEYYEKLKDLFLNRNDVLTDLNKVLAAEARIMINPREVAPPPDINENDNF